MARVVEITNQHAVVKAFQGYLITQLGERMWGPRSGKSPRFFLSTMPPSQVTRSTGVRWLIIVRGVPRLRGRE